MFEVEAWVKVNKMPSGRRLWAVREVAGRARGLGAGMVVAACEEAIAHEEGLRRLEARWASQVRASQAKGDEEASATEVDRRLDRSLAAIFGQLQGVERVMGARSPQGKEAKELLERLFPKGLGAVVNLPFGEEVESAEEVVKALASSGAGQRMGVELFVEQLGEAVAKQRAILGMESRPLVYKEVRLGQEAGHRNLCRVVGAVLGVFWRDTQEHVDARASLLGPIAQQSEAVGEAMRRKTKPQDLDPATGQPSEPAPDGDEDDGV